MDILTSKQVIINNFNNIFESYQNEIGKVNSEINIIQEKLNQTLEVNKKLIEEVSEKDKQLFINEKKMVDYEQMINKIQEEASKELTEKERFSMLKAKDREIHDRDIEIKRLQNQINLLKKKEEDNNSIEIQINEVSDKLVDRMKKVMDEEEPKKKKSEKKKDEEPEQKEPEQNVGDPNPDTEVIESDVTEVDADSDSEEECSVVEITYKKKKYYIIEGESPQYMYEIEDDGLGKKVGEVKGKRKVLY